MALQSTTLGVAITAAQTKFQLSSGSNTQLPSVGAPRLPVGVPMQIDAEYMYCVEQPVLNTIVVRGRGSDGTNAVAHDILSNVYFSNQPGDFPNPQAGTLITTDFAEDVPISIGQDSTIVPAGANAVYNINKASACAITLSAPSLADNGVSLVFTSNTAFAHTITATGLIQDGSGNTRNTATFAANRGNTVVLVVENGSYNIEGAPQNVTFS